MFEESGMMDMKEADTPLETSHKFEPHDGEFSKDQTKCRKIVGKLIYFTVSRLDLSFAGSVVSQFI